MNLALLYFKILYSCFSSITLLSNVTVEQLQNNDVKTYKGK